MAMGLTGNAADIANRLVAASRSLHSAADGPAAGATDDPRHRAPEMSGSMPPGLYMSATDAVRAGDDLMGSNLTTGTPEPALPAVSHGTGPVPVMDVGSAPLDDGMARERAALASARRPCAAADPATPLGLAGEPPLRRTAAAGPRSPQVSFACAGGLTSATSDVLSP